MRRETSRYHSLYWVVGLALFPLIVAMLYVTLVNILGKYRYDEAYFTPYYQDLYQAPYLASGALERAIQTGDADLYAELTGLRRNPSVPETNPNIVYAILLEVDDNGYFHYMFFDKKTYERSMFYLQEVGERWVVSPEDAYFHYHSGRWLKVFIPLTIVYWLILFVVELVVGVFRVTGRERDTIIGV